MRFFPTKMLLATDGSEEANLALKCAVGLANSTNSELHVVLVQLLPYAYDAPEVRSPELGFFVESHERACKRLDAQVEEVRLAGGRVAAAYLRVGTAAREIVALAEEMGAGLVVLGSRGLSGVRRALMGSVSMNVVHHAHCSVLVVRDSGGLEGVECVPGKVLLAYDGSEEASAAARVASEIADATGYGLHLLHVASSEGYARPFGYGPYEEAQAWEAWEANLERDEGQARSFVEGQVRRMESEGTKVEEGHVSFGRPDREIVGLAEELGVGLTVVGSRGLGGVRRALMGSVSDSVVRHAHCPVLVVRKPSRESRKAGASENRTPPAGT